MPTTLVFPAIHNGSKCSDANNDCCVSPTSGESRTCVDGYVPRSIAPEKCKNNSCAALTAGVGCYGCYPPTIGGNSGAYKSKTTDSLPTTATTTKIGTPLASTTTAASVTLPACANKRYTGYNDHRTLHIPAVMWDVARDASANAVAWSAKLCCVFTWTVRDEGTTNAYMITYDGSRRHYRNADTFSEVAKAAYDAICAMFMGSKDCEKCGHIGTEWATTSGMFAKNKDSNTLSSSEGSSISVTTAAAIVIIAIFALTTSTSTLSTSEILKATSININKGDGDGVITGGLRLRSSRASIEFRPQDDVKNIQIQHGCAQCRCLR